MSARPAVIVVSHTHWDREWYQPFDVFRARLCDMVERLLDILDGDAQFRHFMLDGQTVCLDDVLELRPSLEPRLRAHIAAGRIGVGPWYVLQDEFLVGGESIVRNLSEGLKIARRFGRPMPIGYLPDAFGHIAQMPRILRGFGLLTAVVWRGVGDRAPGSEFRWRAPSGADVLCLFLPGGYGNAHHLSDQATERLHIDLTKTLPLSRASVLLWMNGNDHQSAEPDVPATLAALARAHPDVDFEHAPLERAAALVRERTEVDALPVVEGELRRATPTVPVLAGTLSARSWQKRDHDLAETLLVRFVEPFVALAGLDRQEAIDQAWRTLLQCQPHDSICGCSIDEVHRDVDARLRRVDQLGRELLRDAVYALVGARTPDFALHEAIAIVNPHPFAATALVEVELQRLVESGPFRLVGPTGEAPYEIVARTPTDGPGLRPAEWLRIRLLARDLPPLGLRTLALASGDPTAFPMESPLEVRHVPGGVEIVDRESDARVVHTFEDDADRGDLYDFCPVEGAPTRSSRDGDLGGRVTARTIGRRVEFTLDLDNRTPDHRLRARFDVAADSFVTDTAFGWLPRTTPGTHPVSSIATATNVALGGPGLHEIERTADGALLLTLFRAIGWMSRGDLSTRNGHAGYHVQTPDAQGLGHLQFRYALAVGPDAVRTLEPGLIPPRAVPLERAIPSDRPFLSVDGARLSICKRAGDDLLVRLIGAGPAQLRFFAPIASACLSDLDERKGPAVAVTGRELAVDIASNDIVTLRCTRGRGTAPG